MEKPLQQKGESAESPKAPMRPADARPQEFDSGPATKGVSCKASTTTLRCSFLIFALGLRSCAKPEEANLRSRTVANVHHALQRRQRRELA